MQRLVLAFVVMMLLTSAADASSRLLVRVAYSSRI
jgi:hypothetical protein